MRPAVAIGALAALLAAGSVAGASRAAFTARDAHTALMSTASDWVAPAVTITTPADGGYSRTTSITLSGAAGAATGDSATVTVNVYAGTSATGTPVLTRGVARSGAAWSTTVTTLGQGTYTARATQADSGGNTGTSTASTFTIDTTAPTRVSVSAANGTGTSGHLDAADTITFAYSEPIVASSILAGWSGTSAASVNVRFVNGGSADAFTVLDSAAAANVKLDTGTTTSGGVALGANFVSGTVTFAATMTRSANGTAFVVTLGSPDIPSRVVSTPTGPANMTWTPKAGPTDLAGNALASTAAWTETDGDRDF